VEFTDWNLLAYGDYADLYWERSRALSLRWEEGKLERLAHHEEGGAGLRYCIGEETRYACADEPTVDKIQSLARRLWPAETLAQSGRCLPRAEAQSFVPRWRRHPRDVPISAKVQLIERCFRAASIPSVKQVTIHYGEVDKHIRIWTSEGEATEERRLGLTFSIAVVAEAAGWLQTAYDAVGGTGGYEFFETVDIVALARKVAERAVRRLSAPPAPLGEMPIIIAAEAGGTLIHEAIGHPLEADAVQKGVSPMYHGAVGKVVGNEKVSVVEDPTMAGQRGFYAFDDEAVPAERVMLVDHGVLKTYLYDRLTARKAGVKSNGHGRRESYRHRPIPRMANTFVAPGPDDPQMILRSVREGLLVTKMGGGQVEPATGDFVFEVEEGFLIHEGQVGPLIRSANLLGNGPDVLKSIDLVGSDMGWSVGTCGKDGQGAPVSDGLPTLRIPKGIVVGGISA
jgi:TldD protein